MSRQDEVAAWQNRLIETFSAGNVVGGRLLIGVIDLEIRAGQEFISTFKGYRIQADSFFEFFAESLECAVLEISTRGYPKDENYAGVLLEFQVMFRAFRAAETLATSGYPLDGYALLRNLAERAILIASLIAGLSTPEEISGTAEAPNDRKWNETDLKLIRKRKRKEELRIFDLVTGKNSGLSQTAVFELDRWNRMFDMQVHGSHHSKFGEVGKWMFEKGKPFSIGPMYDESAAAMYFNRATEISWFIVRLLPYLQQEAASFGKLWAARWQVMDDSLRFSVDSLLRLEKKIAAAIIELVEKKFNFSPETFYVAPTKATTTPP